MQDKKQLNVEIGMRIQFSREKTGLTQEQLAEKIDRSTQFISTIERGVAGPSLETVISLCNVLDVSSDWLLRGIRKEASADTVAEKLSRMTAKSLHAIDRIADEILLLQK